jgi:hypothetical protein
MKSSLATRKLAVEANADCRGDRDSPFTETVSGGRKPERILGMVPDKWASGKPAMNSVARECVERTGGF